MLNAYQKTLTIGLGSAIALSSFLVPQIVHATPFEEFTLTGGINNPSLNDNINGSLSGSFTTDLDSPSFNTSFTPIYSSIEYSITDWDITYTSLSGDVTHFISDGVGADSAYLKLFPNFDSSTTSPSDRLSIVFLENNNETKLELNFSTNYNIETSTTLTELLEADSWVGTAGSRSTSSIIFNQTSSVQHLTTGAFAIAEPLTEEVVSSVPEPSTIAMLGLGSLMMFGAARRAKRKPSIVTKES